MAGVALVAGVAGVEVVTTAGVKLASGVRDDVIAGGVTDAGAGAADAGSLGE